MKDEVRKHVPVVEGEMGEVKEDVRGCVLVVGWKTEVGEVKEEDRGHVPVVPVGRRR